VHAQYLLKDQVVSVSVVNGVIVAEPTQQKKGEFWEHQEYGVGRRGIRHCAWRGRLSQAAVNEPLERLRTVLAALQEQSNRLKHSFPDRPGGAGHSEHGRGNVPMDDDDLRTSELRLDEEIAKAEAEAAAMVEQARKAQEVALSAAREQTGGDGPSGEIGASIEARLAEAERYRQQAIVAAEDIRRQADAEWAAAEAEMLRYEAEAEAELAAADATAERAEAEWEDEQSEP
jgi:hypothetical protein